MHAEAAEAAEALVVDAASRRARPVAPSGRPLVVLTFGNHRYGSVIVNWMVGMHRLGVDNYEVICMDDELAAFMISIGRPCSAMQEVGGDLQHVWLFRLRVLERLLHKGTDVLLSDADAVWLRNPLDFLGSGDIVASRGILPIPMAAQLGATVCMGWAFFRGTPAVARFVGSEVLARYVDDDQVAVNDALVAKGLHFPSRLDFMNSTGIDNGSAGDISVRLLDHRRFQRICNPSTFGKAYVAHCLCSKDGQTKKVKARENGLWFLSDAWEKVPLNGRFHEWIGTVASKRH